MNTYLLHVNHNCFEAVNKKLSQEDLLEPIAFPKKCFYVIYRVFVGLFISLQKRQKYKINAFVSLGLHSG